MKTTVDNILNQDIYLEKSSEKFNSKSCTPVQLYNGLVI